MADVIMLVNRSDKNTYVKAMTESYLSPALLSKASNRSSDDKPSQPEIDAVLHLLYIFKVGYYVFKDDRYISERLRNYFLHEGVYFDSILEHDRFYKSRISLILKESPNSVLDQRENDILSSFCRQYKLEDGFLHNLITIKDSKSEGERKVSPERPPQNIQPVDALKAKTLEPIN
ncbi:MAG: hypothetical protein P4M13_04285 [Alphaproteobacteria bacterium]|nr:hypothetical protein [Alphaproteobacteria bacterium]